MDVIVTKHAEKRIRERQGLNKKACERMAKMAYEKGLIHEDKKGTLNKYLIHKENVHKTATKDRVAKIYGEYLYIFDGNTLITTFGVPNEIKPMIKKRKENSR